MKKILIILLVALSLPVAAQTKLTLNATQIHGTDTTLYLRNTKHDMVTIDFTTTNANTATLDLGHSDDRVSFVTATVTGITFPITLSKSTYTKTANGYTRNRILFYSGDWPGTYIAIKLTKVDVTTGYWDIWY